MARSVYLHIGLPKTATTYLQTIMWGSRPELRSQGVLLPGRERRDHLWSSRVIREDPNLAQAPQQQRTAWRRLTEELAAWSGTGIVSHEFFAAATAEQAQRMVDDLAPAEVHLVVTAREPLGLFTASWQESLKNRHTRPIEKYAVEVSSNPNVIWNWRTLDLRLVLERWAPTVPPERVHVLPLDTSAPREEIWHRFGGLLGLDTDAFDLSGSFPNESMGVVEAEVLRRVNSHLGSFQKAFDRGVYIRTFLADERLVPRRGEKFWPPPAQVADCRARGEQVLEYLASQSFDVRGDVERLRVPEVLPERRTPDSVTDAEVAEVAVELVAVMLGDVRDLRTAAKREPATPDGGLSRLRRWWRSRRYRSGR